MRSWMEMDFSFHSILAIMLYLAGPQMVEERKPPSFGNAITSSSMEIFVRSMKH